VTTFPLSVTTQGPPYPPSEVMTGDGDFIVVGRVNRAGENGQVCSPWGAAIVRADSPLPPFGQQRPYDIVRELSGADRDLVLHTLPVPLPCNNYPMVFAPDQWPEAERMHRPSHPFHEVPIPDLRAEDGPKVTEPITLGQWLRAEGTLDVTLTRDRRAATFRFEFANLIPSSLYTVMSLRERDLDPAGPTRPGPLGVPNVFVADEQGRARYSATLPNPFPAGDLPGRNRVLNIVVLWMSYQQSYGGAIGRFGLGGDIHAQLKLREPSFLDFVTTD
jgi:hypothetical protein